MKNEKVRFRTIELDKEDTEVLIEGMMAEMKFIDDIEMENRHLSAEDKSRRKILSEMMIKFKKAGLEWKEVSDGIFEVNIDGQQMVRMRVRD
jgi:hypothetical protein